MLLLLYKFFKKSVLFFCFFFYLYAVQFKGVPVTTRILFAVAGFIILLFSIAKQADESKDIFISKGLIRYLIVFAALVAISIFSLVVNNTRDIEFVKYPLSLIFILLAGYFLHFTIKKLNGEINYTLILNYIVAAVFVQAVISLVSFAVPVLSDTLQNIQNISDLDVTKLQETASLRLNGFGSTFFGAGIINGFALISIAALIRQKNNAQRRIVILSFAFITILSLGTMMARTTLVGGILAVFFLLLPTKTFNKKMIKAKTKFFGYILLLPVLLIAMIFTFFPSFSNTLQTAASFGFEMFINYSETGEFSTASTNALKTMYVFPDNPQTYFIGDGQYYIKPGDPSSGYYKSTDVGYLRLIYYFGIPGLLIYLALQYTAVINALKTCPSDKTFRIYILLVFLLCIINNFKGFTDLFFLINLFVYNAKPAPDSKKSMQYSIA
jgi:hypothetical protein